MSSSFSFLIYSYKKTKKLLLFVTAVTFFIPYYSYATHIVGGELGYKCLGGNQYEIKLTVYRDCYNGVPPFDNPAAVGIFDINNVLITTVYLNFPGSTLLPSTVAQADACVQPGVGTNVCTEVAEYLGTVTLPPRVGGYQLAYQRCCRNPTINNIVNPGSTGATYYARIPDKAFSCNSSPLFKNFPSIFTCVNTPIIFDNSATDADGDSIAYYLCAPLTGATGGNSQPQPPGPPPYSTVTWQAPYSASNLLGGVPLAIDPKTGAMSGTPNTLGQFVVGVCADEFRNGVLINTTKRDFQFNVINCRPDVVAAAGSYISDCNNHTITFTNNSTGNATYSWNFGVLPITTDTSSLKNPSYTYPSLGTYTVTLIAISARGPTCNDTLKTLIVVVDTCKPCAMTLGITKVDGTCGNGGGCTVTPNTLAQWNGNIPPNPDPCVGTGINIWYQGVPDPIGTSPSNTYYLCGATYYTITSAQWTFKTEPPGNACPGAGSFVSTRDPGKQFYYVCPCTGGSTGTLGSATVTPATGTSPYTYSWSPSGGTTATASNLSAGTYTVTVTDAAGCVKTSSVVIDANSTIALTTSQTLPSSCIASDGTASVTASGGATPYTYLWSNGQTTSIITGLPTGLYTVIVTDGNGCNKSVTIAINQSVVITVGTSLTDAKCKGNNGTGTAIPSGGSGTYTYSWTTSPVQTTITATGLQSGYYIVTVTDTGGCSNTAGITITNQSLALTSTVTPVSCNSGANGTATITATGGTPVYTYSWNSNPVQTTTTATGLSAGTYIGKVTDAAGCIDSVIVIITEPSLLLAEPKNTSTVTCAGIPTGSAHVDISGGTSAFTYLWNNGNTSADITGLSAGNYTVTVTDSKGCTASNTIDIIFPSVMSLTKITSDLTCKGNNNGGATVSPIGGSPNYTYSWSTTPAQTNQTATNLSAGTYSVTVADSKGCTSSLTNIIINEPAAIVISTSSIPIGCTASNGTVSATATGGTGSMSYLWSPSGQTTATATGLSAGTYTITVTDTNGCTNTGTATVAPNPTVSISGSPSTICIGGSAVLTATGGGTYLWSANAGSATTASVTVNPVATSTYTVTVTIGTCTTSATQVVTIAPAITANITGTNTVCAGGSTTLTANGGNSYLWSANAGSAITAAISVTPAVATTYTVTVTSGSCTASATTAITVNPIPSANISGTNTICTGGNTTLTASGGGTYSWNTGETTTTITVSPIANTTYTVTVTNSGCTAEATQAVTIISPPTSGISGTNTICLGNSTILTASGGGTYSWNTGETTTAITVSPVNNTTYTVTVNNGICSATATQAVTVTPALTTSISGTNTICSGTSTTLIATGGGTYTWNTAETTSSITVTPSSNTTYTVTVSNGNCTATATQEITVNTTPIPVISGPTIICADINTATLTASGGGTYQWSANAGGGTTAAVTVTPGSSSTYTVTVTIGNCSASTTYIVKQSSAIVITKSKTDASCSGANDGTATISASGGTPGYTYSWNTIPIQTNSLAIGLTPGTYIGTVTDVNGCSDTVHVIIIGKVNNVTANFNVKYNITCDEGITATFADSSSGATSWFWDFGDGTTSQLQNPSHTYNYGQTATVTFIAKDGACSDTISLVISFNALNDYIDLKTPNVFTPNDDGINDCFLIGVGNGLEKCVHLKIVDRWGLLLFESTRGSCWDGTTTAGIPVSAGTYFYIIKISDTEIHGALSLYR